jgi:hypothetical protein
VGFAGETRDLANSLPPEVELWGTNVNHKFMKRWDRWFQLHPPVWKGLPFYGRSLEHMKFLETCGVPLYMRYPSPGFPTSLPYPYEDVYASIGRRYLTSTGAHAVALAIHEQVDEIKLYGVNLASNTEYVEQRPCIEWLLGLAEGRGIKVDVPSFSSIFSGSEYPGEGNESPRELAQARLDTRRKTYNKYWARVHNASGALEALRMLESGVRSRVELAADWQGWGAQSSEHLNMMKGQIVEAKFWLVRAGGFDRHASVMPLQHVPKGYFPPEIEERLNGAVIEEDDLENPPKLPESRALPVRTATMLPTRPRPQLTIEPEG